MVGVKAFALGIALLRTAAACSCIAQYLTVCEQAQEADVVVFATAVNSSKPTEDIDIDINEDVTFTLEIQTLYQGDVDPKEPLTFTTCGNSACCGIYLEVGQEYLIGLYGDDVDDLYGQSCGLFRGGITEDEKEGIDKELQECEEDPCKRACVADSQECVFFEEEWICGELSCDPSPCADNEYCNVEKWDCTVEPCPTLAFCRDACGGSCGDGEVCVLADEPQCVPDGGEGECNIDCGEYQECLLFEWPEYPTYLDEEYTRYAPPGERGDDWWYCADVCAPGRCDGGEVCELLPTPCPGLQIPCPPVAVCYDQCSEGCEADEECVYYPDEGYKCTAPPSCDPNPCPEGEDCAILESFPPIVECTPREDECDGSCLEFQECLIYTGSDGVTEPYCADTCAPGRCDPEGCVLEEVTCVREPCPPVAVCTDGCLDCQEDEVCINYPREGYKCAYQSCDPNPCPEGETCAVQETVPPVVVCYTVEDECGAKCGEFQECMIYTHSDGVEEVYCADVCEPGRCGDEETCSLDEVECVRAPCPPVAQCNPAAGPYEYVDCFRDVREDRVLGHRISSDDMTTELCMNHCETRGAAYFATQYGKECWCYTTGRTDFDRHENAEDPAECNMPCAGNKDEICGGKWAFSLHKLDWPEPPTDNKEFVGCYRDTRNDRVFTDKLVQADMTPTVCRKHCYYQDALYYGTQYGSECWCGKSISESDYTKHGGGVCHLPCSGDSSIACGGKWAFDLFEIQFDTE